MGPGEGVLVVGADNPILMCFCFSFAALHCMWDLTSLTRFELTAVASVSLNHQTASQCPHLLFLLLKADTDKACSMSLSLISSLCFPLLQKSKATSVILSAPALLRDNSVNKDWGVSPETPGLGLSARQPCPGPDFTKYEDGFLIGDPIRLS